MTTLTRAQIRHVSRIQETRPQSLLYLVIINSVFVPERKVYRTREYEVESDNNKKYTREKTRNHLEVQENIPDGRLCMMATGVQSRIMLHTVTLSN